MLYRYTFFFNLSSSPVYKLSKSLPLMISYAIFWRKWHMSLSVNLSRSRREVNSANYAMKTPQSLSFSCRGIPEAWLHVHSFFIIRCIFVTSNARFTRPSMIDSWGPLSFLLSLSMATIFCCLVSTKMRNQCEATLNGKKN